ncbi:hydroxymethylglutaryl-CoA synthase [Nannocystis bainbridge]|uniref:Hydroxymethylglutaryl-CoA synthase n=1 Tax=Nannocystis bainbridge TaxID=2995303 RepID=A0ABT5DWV4_9BACT|nr:hydroxymethylglutaryl-CoA synthase [Nannocystis bainbridge]MDC0718105.1 hydroxymethylglutaryl-CoA synthase [Nannocystis bainbridge]
MSDVLAPANPGLSGLSLYVPRPRVPLAAFAEWTGADPGKLAAVVGDAFRVPQPDEDVYTMAAAAVLRLLRQHDVDPARVGMLALGTESSVDNAVGAVIVRGMVDDALRREGRAPLPRDVEVPEVKHACLGGMYALKAALRYVQTDGAERVAIVVAADIAQYERGSSGEPTQGAGAVAMLVEPRARLLALDLRAAGSSSDERGWDFRKPVARHFMREYPDGCRGERDFPVFNGKYSTVCYVEAVVRALDSAYARGGGDPRALLAEPAALLLHRPYDRMPVAALGAAWVWACVRAGDREALAAACLAADVSFDALIAELAADVHARDGVRAQGGEFDPLARTQAVARHVQGEPAFARVLAATQPGRTLVRQLGNLYTASLPAWIAAAFADAHARGLAWEGAAVTLIGYGSGDAAEVWRGRVTPGWREAAGRSDLAGALAGAIDVCREDYEALHERRAPVRELHAPRPFAIAGRGVRYDKSWQDVGVPHYRVNEE